jgi:hypothetical protein
MSLNNGGFQSTTRRHAHSTRCAIENATRRVKIAKSGTAIGIGGLARQQGCQFQEKFTTERVSLKPDRVNPSRAIKVCHKERRTGAKKSGPSGDSIPQPRAKLTRPKVSATFQDSYSDPHEFSLFHAGRKHDYVFEKVAKISQADCRKSKTETFLGRPPTRVKPDSSEYVRVYSKLPTLVGALCTIVLIIDRYKHGDARMKRKREDEAEGSDTPSRPLAFVRPYSVHESIK